MTRNINNEITQPDQNMGTEDDQKKRFEEQCLAPYRGSKPLKHINFHELNNRQYYSSNSGGGSEPDKRRGSHQSLGSQYKYKTDSDHKLELLHSTSSNEFYKTPSKRNNHFPRFSSSNSAESEDTFNMEHQISQAKKYV